MCPRKDRLPNGVSTSLTIASATAETSASGGTIEAKLSEVYKHVGKILTGFRLVLCSPCLICGRCCARRSCRLSWAVEEHSSTKLLTVLRPATTPRRLSVYRPGGAVDLRTTSSGSIEISETYFILPSMRSSRVRAAISPIRCKGCLTVVRGGVIKPAL